jgi:hypothetical protein
MAVGYITGPSGVDNAVAESWNGSRWAAQSDAAPTGSAESLLNGVSCTSPTACVAVGAFYTPQEQPLIERWDGTTWTVEQAANTYQGSTADLILGDVSCSSTNSCLATVSNTGQLWLEIWNGATWSSLVDPPTFVSLSAVSCASATNCITTGNSSNTPLIGIWNGNSWSVEDSTGLSGLTGSLNAFSCAEQTCFAVGDLYPGNAHAPASTRTYGTFVLKGS